MPFLPGALALCILIAKQKSPLKANRCYIIDYSTIIYDFVFAGTSLEQEGGWRGWSGHAGGGVVVVCTALTCVRCRVLLLMLLFWCVRECVISSWLASSPTNQPECSHNNVGAVLKCQRGTRC